MVPKWLDILQERLDDPCSFLKASIPETNHPVDWRPPSRVEEGCAHYLPHWHVEARPSSAFGCNQVTLPTVRS